MKKYSLFFVMALVFFTIAQAILPRPCFAYWIWTPKIGKWINPKYAVKATPKEQFDWAFGFYEEKNYSKAAGEFDKLVFSYPTSKYAPSSLYYRGLCLEEIGYYYEAYRSYDKVLREYPTFDNIDEIVEREFKIGEWFLAGNKRKIMGVDIFPSLEAAIEIFSSIAEHAPFSDYGAQAQLKVGMALKKAGRYAQAKEAFEKVILNYPNSEVVDEAKYEAVNCSFMVSQKPEYEQTTTRQAIEELSRFLDEDTKDESLYNKAEGQLSALQEKDAEHLYGIAKFYERIKKYESARIYYKEIVDKYPQTSFASKAREKLEGMQEDKK